MLIRLLNKHSGFGLILVCLSGTLIADCIRAVENDKECRGNKNCESAKDVEAADSLLLHVKSPDWRDQIIYSLMLDRFNDGDPDRNDQGVGVYDPSRTSHYSGGDIQGVIDKVDYIKALGATSVWISPPVANQWWDPLTQYTGYHGYWPVDFMEVDKHYGDLETYKRLSHTLHKNDMYLIQDVIVNHVAHYYNYQGRYDPQDKRKNFTMSVGAIPPSPTMTPFDKINLLDPEHAQANIYHWTPEITDYSDSSRQLFTHQLQFLNDINTSNPTVRKALKEAHRYWIHQVGVDGFRLDAAKHVEHDFWHDFIHSENGMNQAALDTGRTDFLTFGELFNFSAPMEVNGEKLIVSFIGSKEKPEIKTQMGFPLYKETQNVFNGGQPTSHLSFRLNAQMDMYPDPYIVLNFINSHDLGRFINNGNLDGLKQAFAMLMTVPGIPVIFQGDEQNFIESRKSLFAGGHLATKSSFDIESDMFQYLNKLIRMRRHHKVFSRGELAILRDNRAGAGEFVFRRSYQNQRAFVFMNTSDTFSVLSGRIQTGLLKGQQFEVLYSNSHEERRPEVDSNGMISLILAPREILIVLTDTDKEVNRVKAGVEKQIIVNQNFQDKILYQSANLSGYATRPNADLKLVIDSNFDQAIALTANKARYWQTLLPVKDFGKAKHTFEVYDKALNLVSEKQSYTSVVSEASINLQVKDPLGDDKGLTGTYLMPTDKTIGSTMDITGVAVKSGGRVMEMSITMKELSDIWGYSNTFDHVAFTIFFDLPGRDGLQHLSGLNAVSPKNFRWNYTHKIYGQGSVMSDTQGADAARTGRLLGIAVDLFIDKENNRFILKYNGKDFGIENWHGVKIYITTWDVDEFGVYRPVAAKPAQWTFGTGQNKALIMDELAIEIP